MKNKLMIMVLAIGLSFTAFGTAVFANNDNGNDNGNGVYNNGNNGTRIMDVNGANANDDDGMDWEWIGLAGLLGLLGLRRRHERTE